MLISAVAGNFVSEIEKLENFFNQFFCVTLSSLASAPVQSETFLNFFFKISSLTQLYQIPEPGDKFVPIFNY